MTEIWANNFGNWYELGLQPVPAGGRLFSASSWINKGITLANRVSSGTDYSTILSQLAQLNTSTTPYSSGNNPGFNTVINQNNFSSDLYVIPTAAHPRQPVYVYKSNYTPDVPPGSAYPGDQQATLLSVPVPLGPDGSPFEVYYGRQLADPASDGHVCIWDPWHDEFFDFQSFYTLKVGGTTIRDPDGSVAATQWEPPLGTAAGTYYYGTDQGGYIGPNTAGGGPGIGVSQSDPSFPLLADGSHSGAYASGIAGGLITNDDIMRGVIPHAMYFATNAEVGYIAPATREDGAQVTFGGAPSALEIPLGSIYRIDPTWALPPLGDLISAHSELAQVGLGNNTGQIITRYHLMVWKAMRDYGIFCADLGGTVTLTLQNSTSLGTPYTSYTEAQIAAQYEYLDPTNCGSAGGPFGTAPWSLIQQVQYPY